MILKLRGTPGAFAMAADHSLYKTFNHRHENLVAEQRPDDSWEDSMLVPRLIYLVWLHCSQPALEIRWMLWWSLCHFRLQLETFPRLLTDWRDQMFSHPPLLRPKDLDIAGLKRMCPHAMILYNSRESIWLLVQLLLSLWGHPWRLWWMAAFFQTCWVGLCILFQLPGLACPLPRWRGPVIMPTSSKSDVNWPDETRKLNLQYFSTAIREELTHFWIYSITTLSKNIATISNNIQTNTCSICINCKPVPVPDSVVPLSGVE